METAPAARLEVISMANQLGLFGGGQAINKWPSLPALTEVVYQRPSGRITLGHLKGCALRRPPAPDSGRDSLGNTRQATGRSRTGASDSKGRPWGRPTQKHAFACLPGPPPSWLVNKGGQPRVARGPPPAVLQLWRRTGKHMMFCFPS